MFYHALSHALVKDFFPPKRQGNLLASPRVCPSSAAGVVGEGQLIGGDKLCWCFHLLLAENHLLGRFSRKVVWASVSLSSCPTTTNGLTHQASMVARDCKRVWKLGGEHLTQKVGPSSSFPVNKASVHTTTLSGFLLPFTSVCNCTETFD